MLWHAPACCLQCAVAAISGAAPLARPPETWSARYCNPTLANEVCREAGSRCIAALTLSLGHRDVTLSRRRQDAIALAAKGWAATSWPCVLRCMTWA